MVVSAAVANHLDSLPSIWKEVDVTIHGPYPPTPHGDEYILLIRDKTTQWIDGVTIQNVDKNLIASALYRVFVRFGFPTFHIDGVTSEMECEIRDILNSKLDSNELEKSEDELLKELFPEPPIILQGISAGQILEKYVKENGNSWHINLDRLLHKFHMLPVSENDVQSSFSLIFGRNFNASTGEEVHNTTVPKNKTTEEKSAQGSMQCQLCTRKFTSKLSLRIHQRKHKPPPRSNKKVEETLQDKTQDVNKPRPNNSPPMRKTYSLRTNLKLKGDSNFMKRMISNASAKRQQSNDQLMKLEAVEKSQENNDETTTEEENSTTEQSQLFSTDVTEDPTTEVQNISQENKAPVVKRRRKKPTWRPRVVDKSLKYKCPTCAATYLSSGDEYAIHMKCHIQNKKIFRCLVCFREKSTWSYMLRHLATHNDIAPKVRSVPLEARTCHHCDKVFTTRESMQHHVEVLHHGVKKFRCETCSEEFKEHKTYKRHLDIHANVIYSCMYCKYKTKIRKNFQDHSRIHDGNGFSCNVCDKIFCKPALLKTHQKTHEIDRALVTCIYCGIKLASDASMRIHIRNKHESSDIFTCTECDYVAKVKGNLISHTERRHNKQIKCSLCNYTSHSQSALDKHKDIFHNVFRKHPCKDCGYRAYNSRQLLEHIKFKHSPGARRFPCQDCGAKFKTMTLLRHHLPAHTGQHLYSCRLCSYSAKYRQTLHYHIKAKHPGTTAGNAIRGTRFVRKDLTYPSSPKIESSVSEITAAENSLVLLNEENEVMFVMEQDGINQEHSEIVQGIQLEDGSILVDGSDGSILVEGSTLHLPEEYEVEILTGEVVNQNAQNTQGQIVMHITQAEEPEKPAELVWVAVDSEYKEDEITVQEITVSTEQ